MHSSLVLIEGDRVDAEDLRTLSLGNALQIVVGSAPDYGYILHVAATSAVDLEAALRDFAAVRNVTGVITLATRLTG